MCFICCMIGNRVNPDERPQPHSVASHLGLHCFCLGFSYIPFKGGLAQPLYLIETPLQTEQTQSCLISAYSVCLWKYDKSDPTPMELTSNLSYVEFILYNYS